MAKENVIENSSKASKKRKLRKKIARCYRYLRHPISTYRTNKDRKSAKKQFMENRLITVMDNTGWDKETALNDINRVRNEFHISSANYVKFELYNAPKNGVEEYYQQKQLEKKELYKQNKDKSIHKVMEKTGWDYDYAKKQMNRAMKRTHCNHKEYYIYRMYDLTKAQQDQIFLRHQSKQLMKRYDVGKKLKTVLCNKELTNETFADCVKRAWCVNTKTSLKKFKQKFANSTKIIYKPIGGHKGFGVETFDICPENIENVYNQLSALPTGVVEEFVKQHEAINKLCATSVNTVRIVTISSNSKPITEDGKMFDIAYVAFRIGSGDSIVDNFHSGGMVAAVDKTTGIVLTDAVDEAGNVYTHHPSTGTKIKGFAIPYFDEAIKIVTKQCKKHKIENYLGWDMAISENGPELIEVNNMPAAALVSTPLAIEKKGIKPQIDKYLY